VLIACVFLTLYTAGTNPIHNKKPKKKAKDEEDDEDKAFKLKQAAGMRLLTSNLDALSASILNSARQEGSRRNGQEGWWQGPHRNRRHQEERQEISRSLVSHLLPSPDIWNTFWTSLFISSITFVKSTHRTGV